MDVATIVLIIQNVTGPIRTALQNLVEITVKRQFLKKIASVTQNVFNFPQKNNFLSVLIFNF